MDLHAKLYVASAITLFKVQPSEAQRSGHYICWYPGQEERPKP
jgi:hypothetical protein